MGRKNIANWIYESLQKDNKLKNDIHQANMEEIYDILEKYYEVPVRMELISVAKVYKLIFADGRIEKISVCNKHIIEMQEIAAKNGLRVPKIVKIIPFETHIEHFYKIQEWIEGTCRRDLITGRDELRGLPGRYWHKLGVLLAGLNNCRWCNTPITMHDILWSNLVIDKEDNVWIIDCRKLMAAQYPLKTIYDWIIFNQFLTDEQIREFTKGYNSIEKKSDEVWDIVNKHTKIFSGVKDEELARV